MKASSSKRVLVIGLDCAAPRFIFGPEAFDLPNLHGILNRGAGGILRSCDPPITVPAWSCMTSGKDPGTLGIYGFRNRGDYSYDAMSIATSDAVHEKRIWDLVGEAGKQVVVLGVPQTYPVRPVNGCLVSGLLTPDTSSPFTHPPELGGQLLSNVGDYIIDVPDFRSEKKDALLDRIFRFMHNRFDTARYLLETKPWDFFMMVDMGMDRLHHAFWQYADPDHPAYEADNPYRDALRRYYEAVDERIGDLITRCGNDTAVLVVSDHGARALHGGLCINQWLLDQGYLVLKSPPSGPTPLEQCAIDWERTQAWSAGGYYARIHLNLRGREPQGCVEPTRYEALRDELKQALEALDGPDKRPMGNRALKPEKIYANVKGVPPDLLVYFGEMKWRSVGLVGCDGVFSEGNDTGPDGANHDFDGVILIDDACGSDSRRLEGANLMDVAPTVLDLMNIEIPADIQGKSLV